MFSYPLDGPLCTCLKKEIIITTFSRNPDEAIKNACISNFSSRERQDHQEKEINMPNKKVTGCQTKDEYLAINHAKQN